jgi:hypothetical protein
MFMKRRLFARGLRLIRFPPQFIQLPDTVGLNLISRPQGASRGSFTRAGARSLSTREVREEPG